MKLYHYTNTEGKIAIESSEYIRMSQRDGRRDDAMYGKGVYLTSIPPNASTREILGNNWDGKVIPERMKERTEWYFEFDTDDGDLRGVESVGDKHNRDIWLLRDKNLPCRKKAGRRTV